MADEHLISVRFRALTSDLEAGARRAGASIRGMQAGADRDLKTLGQSMQSAGRSMTLGLTVPIAAGVAFAAREIISFESAMAGVAKTVDLTDAEFEAMSQGIRDMAMELPASREEIAAVAEAAGQLGIQKDQILAFTRTMIDLGESTNLTADEAATSMAQLANITQMPQSEFRALGDTLVALGNAGASTEADILDLGQRLAAAGDQAGLSEAEILGLASAMADVGINAEMGGTSMSQVLGRMRDAAIEGGPRLEAFADAAGMTADQFARMFQANPDAAISAFVEGLGRISAEGGTMTPVMEGIGLTGERVRDTLGRLAGAGDRVAESFGRANAEFGMGALAEEAARRYETTGAQLEIAWNQITDAAMEIGDVVVPIFAELAGVASGAAQAFADLPEPLQQVGVALAGLAAAAGPAIWAGGSLVSAWATLGPALAGLTSRLGPSLMAGAAGFGPLGIAATTAAAAFAVFSGSSDRITTDVESLTRALIEQEGVTGTLSQQWLVDYFTSGVDGADQLLQALSEAGIGFDELDGILAMSLDEFNAWSTDVQEATNFEVFSSDDMFLLGSLRRDRQAANENRAALEEMGGAGEEAFAGIEEGASEAEAAVADLETAWARLNNLLSDEAAAIAARQALRSLKEEAFGALEDGIDPGELDSLRQGVIGYAESLQDAAEAANTNAQGVLNARGAQRDLLASMRDVRDEIPSQLLPMWDRMIQSLGRPARLNADGQPARRTIDQTASHGRKGWGGQRYSATLGGDNKEALKAIQVARDAAQRYANTTFTATLSAQLGGLLRGPGAARGEYVRARSGGQARVVAEGGYDEVIVSTDPKLRSRSEGLLARAGFASPFGSPAAFLAAPSGGGRSVNVTSVVKVDASGYGAADVGEIAVREIERRGVPNEIARRVLEVIDG